MAEGMEFDVCDGIEMVPGTIHLVDSKLDLYSSAGKLFEGLP